ncbi:hypothetical protein [Streptomyces poonensis]|uniref:Uncharacterized protein n=1 Tax=Streptomyces poonensis TaxID=68255 RepID=A0A918Q1V3_9ACTN|nr:hypothetical protein [Streptomyces poonensis]GGZ28947.1 hypothetical protein GCM10010365_56440 [Streptomyces poonensis]
MTDPQTPDVVRGGSQPDGPAADSAGGLLSFGPLVGGVTVPGPTE